MKCPICGSDSYEVLKSKKETSKSKLIEKLLLKCKECQTVFRNELSHNKPVKFRIIVSEHEKSYKDLVEVYPDELLKVGDVLPLGEIRVEITSLETKKGSRVSKSIVSDLDTIWGSSLDTMARVGISIDFHGRISSYKVEVERDFIFTIGDLVKIEKTIFKIKSFKTMDRKMRKGSANAGVIKRIYGRPFKSNTYSQDLTSKIVKSSTLESS